MQKGLQEALDNYRIWLRQSRRPPTVKNFVHHAELFCNIIDKPLKEVTPADLTKFFSVLQGKGFQESSIHTVAKGVKRFFKVSGRSDLADTMPQPRFNTNYLPRWVTQDDFKKLVNHSDVGLEKTMNVLSYEVALRIGEVPKLDRAWLNPKSGIIKVFRLKRKGLAEDLVPIRREAFYGRPLDIVLEYLDHREDDDKAMFVTRYGRYGSGWRRIAQRTVDYYFNRALRRAGMSGRYTFHSLRHGRITQMTIDQITQYGQSDIGAIAKFAGHTSTSTTLLYTHLGAEYLQRTGR